MFVICLQDDYELDYRGGLWSTTYRDILQGRISQQQHPKTAVLRGVLRVLAQLGDRLHPKWRMVPKHMQDAWDKAAQQIAGLVRMDEHEACVVQNAMLILFPSCICQQSGQPTTADQASTSAPLGHVQGGQEPAAAAAAAAAAGKSPKYFKYVEQYYGLLVQGQPEWDMPFMSPCLTLDNRSDRQPRLRESLWKKDLQSANGSGGGGSSDADAGAAGGAAGTSAAGESAVLAAAAAVTAAGESNTAPGVGATSSAQNADALHAGAAAVGAAVLPMDQPGYFEVPHLDDKDRHADSQIMSSPGAYVKLFMGQGGIVRYTAKRGTGGKNKAASDGVDGAQQHQPRRGKVFFGAHQFILWVMSGYPKDGKVKYTVRKKKNGAIETNEAKGNREAIGMHLCNNPECLNPLHLVYGTRRNNMLASKKMRGQRENARVLRMAMVEEQAMRHLGLPVRNLQTLSTPTQSADKLQAAASI